MPPNCPSSLLDFFMNLQKKKESKTESILFFQIFFCQSFYFMVSLNCQAMKILKFQRMLDIWKTFTSAFPTLTLTDWPQGNETKMPPKSPQMLVKQFWGTAWVLLKLKLNTPNRHNDSWPTAFATSNSKYFSWAKIPNSSKNSHFENIIFDKIHIFFQSLIFY